MQKFMAVTSSVHRLRSQPKKKPYADHTTNLISFIYFTICLTRVIRPAEINSHKFCRLQKGVCVLQFLSI